MKMHAAILDRRGAEPPYAMSKPLRITTVELDLPGRGELLVRIAAASLCHGDLSVINQLVAEGRTVKGSYIGACVRVRDIPRYVALCCAGKLPVNRLMSGTLALDGINEGFDRLHEGKAVRQVIRFPA